MLAVQILRKVTGIYFPKPSADSSLALLVTQRPPVFVIETIEEQSREHDSRVPTSVLSPLGVPHNEALLFLPEPTALL